MADLQAKADAAMATYQAAADKVTEVQAQIEENTAKVNEITAQIPEKQTATEESMRSLYKMQQGTPGLVSLLLSSESFSDFITTYQYISSVQRANIEAINDLNALESELQSTQAELEIAKQEAEADQQEAQTQLANAQAAIQELEERLAAEAAAAAAKAAAEAEAAAQAAAAQAAADAANTEAASAEAATSDSSNTVTVTPGTNTESGTTSNASAKDGTEVATDATWMYGYASAYCLADNTGWDATASGEKLTDDSVTVAVPASQSYLLGRSVQISYGGITITARVNDTGGFASYGRVLDLAGGCWKAFGFSSAGDWGVRMVKYRFL